MIILDTLLWGGIRFVLTKIVDAVDSELNDEDRLREELLAAQMRFELGEITDAQFAEIERVVLARLREIREERMGAAPKPGEFKVTGIDATTWSDEGEDDDGARRGR